MAWVPSGQFDDVARRPEAAVPAQAALLDQSRYSRRGIAVASAFVAAIVALAAGGQGLAPIFALATLCAMSPSRLQAMLADAELEKLREKVLSPVVKFLGRQGVQLKTIAKVGPAGETIAKAAESGKFDLVVMGTHGHGSLGKLVMGSVSTQVLANCSVPVLLVR